MNSLRTSCVALLLVAACSCAAAAADDKPIGTVANYGILKVVTPNSKSRKLDSPAGERIEVGGVEVVQKTAEIPASLGTSFGILYTITGLPADKPIALKKVVTYPEITKPDGKKQASHTVPLETHSDLAGKVSSFEGYKFTDTYELVPGEWAFEIWHGEDRLLRQVFSVVKL